MTSDYERFRRCKYFPSLDGLRCLSILAVIWHHSLPEHPDVVLALDRFHIISAVWWALWHHAAPTITLDIARRGGLGVELFFVISGFLITTLLLREQSSKGRISLKSFYIRRTLRIFPLYYAAIALFLMFTLRFEHDADVRGDFIHNLRYFLTYTSNLFVQPADGKRVIMILAWSLATEEQFYLMWPPIVRFAKMAWIPITLMVMLICLKEGMNGYVEHLQAINIDAAEDFKDQFWVILCRSIATPICLGCLLAFAMHNPKSFAVIHRVLGQVWSAPLFLMVMVAAGLFLPTPTLDPVTFLTMTLLVGACCIRQDHLLRQALGNAAVRYVGAISYGLYLLHEFAVHGVRVVFEKYGADPANHALLNFLSVAALAIVLASISYWTYERWFLLLKNRFEPRSETAGKPPVQHAGHARPLHGDAVQPPNGDAPQPLAALDNPTP